MYIPRSLTAVFIQFPIAGEDDESNLGITKHRELMSLLKKSSSAFGKGDLPCGLVLYP